MRNSWDGCDAVRSDAVRRAAAEMRGSKWFGILLGACVALLAYAAWEVLR